MGHHLCTMDELELIVVSPPRSQPVQQDRNSWKCEFKLLPPALDMTASLASADNWAMALRGAFGITRSPDGSFEAPANIDHTVAKQYVVSVIDDDLKARLIGTGGDLVVQDMSVMATMARVRKIVEAETPLYSRRRTFYEMRQEKDETFTQFAHRKETEARSAEIDKMSDADRLIHELLHGMRKGHLFQKFCEQTDLTRAKMTEIARAYEQSNKLADEENVKPAAARVVTTDPPKDDTANKAAATGEPVKQCPADYPCSRCGIKGHWRKNCTYKDPHCNTCGTSTHTDRACFRKKQQANEAKKENTDKPAKTKRKKSKRKKEKKEKVKDKETADKDKSRKKKKKRRSRSRRARESSSSSSSASPSSSSSSSDSDTSNRVTISISKSETTVLNPKRLEKKILKLEKQIDELVSLKEECKKREERKKIKKEMSKLEKKKDETIMKILSSGPEIEVQISSKKTPPLRVHVSRRSDSKRNSLVTCPDTGANRSMAPERVVKELGMEKHIDKTDNRYSVKNASGDKMRITGSIWLWVHVKGSPHPVRIHFIVSPDLTETLVGCGDLITLGILPRGFPEYLGSDNAMHTTEEGSEDSHKKEEEEEIEFSHIQHESVRKTLTDFSSVFRNRLSKSTRLDTEPMKIELRDDVTIRPLGVSTARLIPARWQDEADEMIRNLLKSRIIEPAGKAGGWCSPSKFVAKPGAPL